MPGLFAGMSVTSNPTPEAPQETPAMAQPVQPTQQPEEEKKSELPGLFAGLGMGSAPTPIAPAE